MVRASSIASHFISFYTHKNIECKPQVVIQHGLESVIELLIGSFRALFLLSFYLAFFPSDPVERRKNIELKNFKQMKRKKNTKEKQTTLSSCVPLLFLHFTIILICSLLILSCYGSNELKHTNCIHGIRTLLYEYGAVTA